MANRTTNAGINDRRTRASREWWILGVGVVAALDLALFLTLRARPGRLAILLWNWGRPGLVTATAALLIRALVTARKSHHGWSIQRATGLAVLCLVLATMGVYRTFPSSHDEAPSQIDFRLPLDGPVTVAWGGRSAAVNYHVGVPAERWGYDLLVTVDGASHRGDGTGLTDYYVYERPVHAPAAGRVVAVHDGDPDGRPGRADPGRAGGNRIVLQVAPAEYVFIAHLKAGTIRVAPEQRVSQGQVLGHVGNSGNSSEPHVHVHVQDTPVTDAGEGIPFYFSNYVVVEDGATVARGMPEGGIYRGRYIGAVIKSGD